MNLYRVAASQGHPDAMNCLAILLEDGRGNDLLCSVMCYVIFFVCSVALSSTASTHTFISNKRAIFKAL